MNAEDLSKTVDEYVTTADGKANTFKRDKMWTVKELAYLLLKERTFIHAMVKAGFYMPKDPIHRQRMATYYSARKWLEDHLDFSVNSTYIRGKTTGDNKRQQGAR